MNAYPHLIHLLLAWLLVTCSPKDSKRPTSPEAPKRSDYLDQSAKDGGRVGNGGGGVRCMDGESIRFTQLHEFYEASREIPEWKINVDFEPYPSKAILDQALETALYVFDKRWRSVYPVLADFFIEKQRLFPSNIAFQSTPLKILADGDGSIGLEDGFQWLQIANQLDNSRPRPWETQYLIQRDLFNSPQFSNYDHAGLLIHEIVYGISLLGGAVDSRFARALTALLFSNQFKDYASPRIDYFKLLKTSSI